MRCCGGGCGKRFRVAAEDACEHQRGIDAGAELFGVSLDAVVGHSEGIVIDLDIFIEAQTTQKGIPAFFRQKSVQSFFLIGGNGAVHQIIREKVQDFVQAFPTAELAVQHGYGFVAHGEKTDVDVFRKRDPVDGLVRIVFGEDADFKSFDAPRDGRRVVYG